MGLKPSEVEKWLLDILLNIRYRDGVPPSIHIYGSAGIGKSETVRRVAEKLAVKMDREFIEYSDEYASEILRNPDRYFVYIDFRLTEVEPYDLTGIPRESRDGYLVYKPFLWSVVLSRSAGLLFLDEITNVQRDDLRAVSYKLLLDRMVGFVKLSRDVYIVSAGNKSIHSALASGFTAPQIDRVVVLEMDAPSVDDWLVYMNSVYGDKWNKKVYVFLKRFENENVFNNPPREPYIEYKFPTPRSWTLYAVASHKLPSINPEWFVGEDAGMKYRAFNKLTVKIDDLLENPSLWGKLSIDEKYILMVALADEITKKGIYDKALNLTYHIALDTREYVVVLLKMISSKERRKELINLLSEIDDELGKRIYNDILLTVL